MSRKMSENLKIVDKTYFERMDDILKKEEKLKLKGIFTPRLKAGIIFTATGSGLVAIGLLIYIYDLAGYSNIVTDKLYNNPRTDLGYEDYLNSSYTSIALFSVGLSSFCLGTVLITVGIPLIVYDLKTKNKNVSISIGFENDDIIVSCKIKIWLQKKLLGTAYPSDRRSLIP